MHGSSSVAAALAASPLDKHEGISDPPSGGCPRWPARLRLVNSASGALVPGRCRATNKCEYCRALYTIETVEMLTLDALGGSSPTLYVVLTAGEHLSRADTYRHLEQLRKAARKRWGGLEWFVQVEFQRRGALHLNLAVKGVPIDQAAVVGELLVERWCERVESAELAGQYAEPIDSAIAVTKYMSKVLAHGMKSSQAPPIGWKGHRTSQTHGYFEGGTAAARRRARASLRSKRELHKAIAAGLGPHDAELAAAESIAQLERAEWEVVQLVPKLTGELLLRTLQNREPSAYMRSHVKPEAAISDIEELEQWRAGLVGVGVGEP